MTVTAAHLPLLRLAPDIEVVSAWGGPLITRQLRCRRGNTHVEALRHAFDSWRTSHLDEQLRRRSVRAPWRLRSLLLTAGPG